MKSIFITLLIFGLLAVPIFIFGHKKTTIVVSSVATSNNLKEMIDLSTKEGKYLLVFFVSNNCNSCHKMTKDVIPNINMPSFHTEIINIDTPEGRRIFNQYKFQMLPTYVIFEKPDKFVTGVGYRDAQQFSDWMNFSLDVIRNL